MKSKLVTIFYCSALLLLFSCGEQFTGEKKLGSRFILVEENANKSYIVYCLSENSLGCNSSYDVIPKRVKDVAFNDRWIIAKSLEKEVENYWLVDKKFEMDLNNCQNISCDSILKAHIMGPLDSISFYKTLKNNDISLNFE